MHESEKWKGSRSVVSDSLWPHRLQPTRLLCPWDFLGKGTGVGCHCLLRNPRINIHKWLHSKNVLEDTSFLPGLNYSKAWILVTWPNRPQHLCLHLLIVNILLFSSLAPRLLLNQTSSISEVTYLEDGACTDHPKSAILSSPADPRSRFSGLMSLWITLFEWQ